MPVTELALSDAVLLAHTLVARAGEESDVRLLFIKGPAAVQQGLRKPRSSVDVDALVDPARRHLLMARLAELGWVDEHPYTSPTILPMHSLACRNDAWPCELDIHDRFPGLFAEHQVVFERLWSRRVSIRLAAQEVPVADPAAHVLVLALNCLKEIHLSSRASELGQLEEWAREHLDEAELRDLSELAGDLRATETCEDFLRAIGAPESGRGSLTAKERRDWLLLVRPSDTTAVSWVEELRRLPPSAWPRYLWYAAWLSEVELRLAEPSLPPGRRALVGARMRRLRRGLRALPAALRNVRGVSREMRDSDVRPG